MREAKPFVEWIVKVAQPCNLACDHCYVYELRDHSWRHKPSVMATATMDQLALRLGEYVRRHALPRVRITLHGGEPLLAGPSRIEHLVTAVRRELRGVAECGISLQSNATLLSPLWMDVFRRHAVSVGVSLDGGRDANDRHRRGRNGRSSYDSVQRGLELLRRPENKTLFAGLLCTVDVANPPLRVYEELLAQEPPAVNFLLPHATWEHPPPGHDPVRTPYADWLLAVFERWYTAPRQETRVRLFEDIMDLALGGLARSESVGLADTDFLVVESDGTIELSDSLKATREGAAATGLDVFAHDFDTVARHPEVADARRGGLAALADACHGCEVVDLCGGGLRAHRFHPRTGFANPSVYCADLRVLTSRIRDRVQADAAALLGSAS
ncbi:FxsB family cyclophane-forming radical SAM/SPASM peptide maturase [Streptomyces gilvus]|uniref:FxsB family cyclophane-forming radical SAM/SPASM peptide maturase n=1 Tax=Streptomyces gilvus TaxID=2920937 RepID=UPI001F1082CD|nr:FxsB family cyclophane-forming radical SAM/SPASM peptide maturase [Streptomyces sp. CME 23]MCH5673620.1 FxsB family radical SAM/SPASM domain protein [Streptomyces sp. CME 23]